MAYDKLISLGGTCTPTWQLRTFCGSDALYPFDWVLTPFASLLRVLENDFAGFADVGCFHLSWDQKSVYNSRYNVLHHHDFPSGAGGTIADHWRDKIPPLPRKYEFMIERWRDALDGTSSVLFVRHQGHFETETWRCNADLSAGDMDTLCRLLEKTYPHVAFDVLFVTAGHAQAAHPRARLAQVGWGEQDWENPSERWKGATQDWQRALASANALPPTPAWRSP